MEVLKCNQVASPLNRFPFAAR